MAWKSCSFRDPGLNEDFTGEGVEFPWVEGGLEVNRFGRSESLGSGGSGGLAGGEAFVSFIIQTALETP
jgi:hypothetical protein